jgi:hypothetical protein
MHFFHSRKEECGSYKGRILSIVGLNHIGDCWSIYKEVPHSHRVAGSAHVDRALNTRYGGTNQTKTHSITGLRPTETSNKINHASWQRLS